MSRFAQTFNGYSNFHTKKLHAIELSVYIYCVVFLHIFSRVPIIMDLTLYSSRINGYISLIYKYKNGCSN